MTLNETGALWTVRRVDIKLKQYLKTSNQLHNFWPFPLQKLPPLHIYNPHNNFLIETTSDWLKACFTHSSYTPSPPFSCNSESTDCVSNNKWWMTFSTRKLKGFLKQLWLQCSFKIIWWERKTLSVCVTWTNRFCCAEVIRQTWDVAWNWTKLDDLNWFDHLPHTQYRQCVNIWSGQLKCDEASSASECEPVNLDNNLQAHANISQTWGWIWGGYGV